MADCCKVDNKKEKDCVCENGNCKCSSSGKNCGCGKAENKNTLKIEIVKLSVSFVALILSFVLGLESLHIYHNADAFLKLISPAWIAIIWCGYPIYKGAFINLFKNKKVTSALLISTAITASVILEFLSVFNVGNVGHSHGYLFAAGEIAFLMALGELIESYTADRSNKGIKKLISLAPKTANLKLGNGSFEVDVNALKIHDIVVVKPLEAVSVDGKVTFGKSSINESTINGESVPRDVEPSDEVYAGTLNMSNMLEIEVTKLASDTTVNKLIRLVREAEKKRAPIARLADKWASYIVPAAVICSVLVFIVTAFAFNLSYIEALIRGVTVLVVFCPCALALATPTAIAAGLGNASANGILLKSGEALENLSKIKTVAFDKTGTLTEGKIEVLYYEAFSMDREEMLNLAANAEKFSTHPIAQAISKIIKKDLPVKEVSETVGLGVKASVDNKTVEVIKLSAMLNSSKAQEFANNGKTVVGVKIDGEEAGFIALSDVLRREAKESVEALKAQKIVPVMLTGDNESTAKAIAKEVNIDNIKHSLLPDQKLEVIESLKAQGLVAMLGDGANDAPALAASDVGIAMGAMGNDIAIETADISLMENNLKKLNEVIRLSKRVITKIKGNIVFSMTINVIAVVLSLFGVLSPVTGALVHNCSSILVCINSALLLKNRKNNNI